ncbi:MAG: copper amine oxidase N-terminal domain-containing protein [Eubacteriales bacterium]|uniref:copper amine oxidase N-terminal domain-containing protein n=1 Tax=Fenollaria sp. TaxID=1965292 RepID=UPI002A7534E8|nr:copper amine oxidase N-terminal domain-containing protein [Fenollaria sp.]MDD7339632.1 copper amine oxidase N-terminal domain-containing protein [Eubacteriales bacterium]MDY3105689.1 copper amine oxidase N-terminal domain-containing protein [Fenollaria sp.]
MKLKKVLLGAIIASQILTASAFAAPDEAIEEFKKAAAIKQEVKKFKDEVKIFIVKDGEKLRVDQKMTDGLRVVNGRTCVGVRDLVNAIEGAKVEWDGTNHIVDITYNDKTISYPVGKAFMWTDGKAVTIDVPAQIDPAISKTFLPIRNIAETLGFKVDWDNKAKEVVLTPGTETLNKEKAEQSNLAWVTASGQRIPKPEELPKTKYGKDKTLDHNSLYKIFPKAVDLTHNPDGSLTYFKGTVLEYTTQAPFKKVDNIGPRPVNWSIFTSNKNDTRVGTAMVTKGHPQYDKEVEEMERLCLNGDYSSIFSLNDNIINDYKNQYTEISKEEYKKQHKKLNRKKSSKYGLHEADFLCKSMDKIYDATGSLDISVIGYFNHETGKNLIFSYSPTYYITKDGAIIDWLDAEEYTKKYGDFIIDKVMISKASGVYFIDIPDISIKEKSNSVKYNCKTLSIGNYYSATLAN